jgi:hypothetical protein
LPKVAGMPVSCERNGKNKSAMIYVRKKENVEEGA